MVARPSRRPRARTPTNPPGRLEPTGFLWGLNPAQRAAVEHGSGPLLVVAGAGSGKTRVLTSRIGYLIATGQTTPDRVLAVTFTNKAAREMKERLSASLGRQADDLWVSTFHSACVRLLRPYAGRVGLTPRFTVSSEDDCQRVIRDIIDDLDLDARQVSAGGAKAAISSAKNGLVDPRQFSVRSSDARANAHARIYAEYQRRLVHADAVDFDDLLVHVVTLLTEHPDVLEHYRARFSHVLVDEYQDTNRAQSAIVEQLAGGHRQLCCVGDGDQSIYGFRAADVGNIMHFSRTFPDATVVVLEQNFRSTGNILAAANAVISHNLTRPAKRLWTDAGDGDLVALRHADDEFDEAAWLADEVATLVRGGVAPGDVAVLCRAKTLARPIEAEIVRRGIACRTVGGTPFFERREIRDLTAYLRLAVNPRDELSFRRCVNVPRRAVGEASVKKVRAFALAYGLSVAEALERRADIEDLPALALAGLDRFAQLLERVRRAGSTGGAGAALEAVLADGQYLGQLLAAAADDEERQYRQQSVGQLQALAADHANIESLLDMAGLIMEADTSEGDRSRVVLMTIHAAKGLEFPCVFVVGMEEGVFPDRRCMEPGELEEERRLAYVAITRAGERLYLSHARRRRAGAHTVERERSRFLDEIPPDLVNPLDVPAEEGVAVRHFAAMRSSLGL